MAGSPSIPGTNVYNDGPVGLQSATYGVLGPFAITGSLAVSQGETVTGLLFAQSGIALNQSGTSPDPTGGALTIATAGVSVARVTPTANRTAVILQPGTTAGQVVSVMNESPSFSVTFDVAATSNVANGASSVIAPLTARTFMWSTAAAKWFPSV